MKALYWLFDGEVVELHEDLQDHVYFDDVLGASVHHPLIIQVMHQPEFNKMVNAMYAQKMQAVEDAWSQKQWHSYVFLHERPYRFDAMQEIDYLLSDDEWWELLGSVWIDSENIRQHQDEWDAVLRSPERGSSHAMMTDDEYAALRAMPETFTVWQGCTDDREDGWSWTTEFDTAVWFARRFSDLENGEPRVREATVRRDDVTAYLLGRNEFEVIIDPKLVQEG